VLDANAAAVVALVAALACGVVSGAALWLRGIAGRAVRPTADARDDLPFA
jgi:hypothetical protein